MKVIVNLNGREYGIYGGVYIEFQDKTGMTMIKNNNAQLIAIIPKDAVIIIDDNIEKTEQK